jgi:hypothetical protein
MTGNRQSHLLTKRDAELLTHLGLLRIIDREQAKVLGPFGSTTRVNARLLVLARLGLLKRFFIGTRVGTKKSIYALTAKGAAIAGQSYRRLRIRSDEVIGADPTLNHLLHINEIYIHIFKERERAGLGCWRTFVQPLSPTVKLIPDSYFELSALSQGLFLEVDMGTETSRVWKQKADEYIKLALSQDFRRLFDREQFRVLVVTNPPSRLEMILKAVRSQTQKVFWVTSFDAIKNEGFWSPIWRRPVGDQLHSLL